MKKNQSKSSREKKLALVVKCSNLDGRAEKHSACFSVYLAPTCPLLYELMSSYQKFVLQRLARAPSKECPFCPWLILKDSKLKTRVVYCVSFRSASSPTNTRSRAAPTAAPSSCRWTRRTKDMSRRRRGAVERYCTCNVVVSVRAHGFVRRCFLNMFSMWNPSVCHPHIRHSFSFHTPSTHFSLHILLVSACNPFEQMYFAL